MKFLIGLFLISALLFSSLLNGFTILSYADTNSTILQKKAYLKTIGWICPDGLVIIKKISNSAYVCVKYSTAKKLVERKWGMIEFYKKPELSDTDAFQIVKADILQHVPNIQRILYYVPNYSSTPDFQKYPLRLSYEDATGIQSLINTTDYSVINKCDTAKTDLCPVQGKERVEFVKNKFTYNVPVDGYLKNHYLALNYFIDASNGDILWSDLDEYRLELNQTGDWKP